nr:uncharacterized protein LOC100183527 [Ciona intestinalis]|eukprot:XP_002128809.1 uncharacterized protein LOC100183527 [Ciona intestinalis]
MTTGKTLWACVFIWCIMDFQADGFLNIVYDYDVSGVYGHPVEMTCKVETEINKVVKEVKWYKVLNDGKVSVVYYYEPPKWDTPGLRYLDRVKLANDETSLVISSLDRNDESDYRCDVTVMVNETTPSEIPQEMSVTMHLTVFVPPSGIKLTTLTSGNNLTLTCRSTRSKPSADITWIITTPEASWEIQSSKTVSEGPDTIGYLYQTITPKDKGTTFTCVVNHPETSTTLKKNVSLVEPSLQNQVPVYFDWLGAEVPYTTYATTQNTTDSVSQKKGGLVEMVISPAQTVEINTTVIAMATAEGAFPSPTFTWWGEDLETSNEPRLITHLEKSQVFFCLIENPVGRVVMSVKFTAVPEGDPAIIGDNDQFVGDDEDETVLASGAVVAAIAFGGLLILFLLSFVIYYFGCKRPTDRQLARRSVQEDGDFDSYVEKQKPLYGVSPSEETNQIKSLSNDHVNEIGPTHEKDVLLTTGRVYDSPPSTKKNFYVDSTSTSTSGFSDDGNGKHLNDGRSSSHGSHKERAITKHLNDFDENASFCDEYGSRFGLDDNNISVPNVVEVEARESPFDASMKYQVTDDSSETSSIVSGDTVEENRYAIAHHPDESWERIDPMKEVQTPV